MSKLRDDMITSNERNVFMKSEFIEKKLHPFEGRISACLNRRTPELFTFDKVKKLWDLLWTFQAKKKVVFFWILLP